MFENVDFVPVIALEVKPLIDKEEKREEVAKLSSRQQSCPNREIFIFSEMRLVVIILFAYNGHTLGSVHIACGVHTSLRWPSQPAKTI